MLAVDLLGNQRAMGAGLLDDALGKGNLLAGLLRVGVRPLEHLMAAPVRDDETSHSVLLCCRLQPARGPHAVPALAVGAGSRLRRVPARVKWSHRPLRAGACALTP